MKDLIIGFGEIGKSLAYVFSKENRVYVFDKFNKECNDLKILKGNEYDIMHICFPYSKGFIQEVRKYQKLFNPKYTIIHSTVPVGTSRKLNALHSPVTGIHPDLKESLTTFVKWIGGEKASEVANHFRRSGMKVHLEDKQETTELLKIQCTTFYALMIEFSKDMKVQMDKIGTNYSSFLLWNDNYNKGYEKLGYPEYKKPLLEPIMTRQGGHCTIPNLELLKTKFTKFLKEIV
jgi:hypothetical protein